MEDDAPKENPPADFNKLDLSQLQGFSFGTQWTQDKSPSKTDREGGDDRPRREDRREGGAPDRRDRRSFRRPAGDVGATPGGPGAGPERREFSGDRGPRREPRGDFRGGPRREFRGREQQGYGRREPIERGPYESPYFTVTFYPEDTSFNTLVQTIRKTCRTIELFEIARTVVAKPDRFVVVLAHKTPGQEEAGRTAPATGAPMPEPTVRATKPLFYISVPDGMPFESDDAAVAHVLSKHLDKFFETAEVEVEAPKGNFQVINRCGVTGELLGPPNYHRYNQIVQQHYAAKIAGRMPFEAFRSRIETVRDPEVVNQWPGDVIGLVGHSEFGIGDTLTEDREIIYDEIPRFPPEVFSFISNPNPSDAKKYRAGLDQLLQEGVVQAFSARNAPPGATLLAAVGPLQFEVVQWRLQSEYNAESRLTPASWTLMRWIEPHPLLKDTSRLVVATGVSFGTDKFDHPVVFFPNDWTMRYFQEKNPELRLHELPLEQAAGSDAN